jgi:hypothetical protein
LRVEQAAGCQQDGNGECWFGAASGKIGYPPLQHCGVPVDEAPRLNSPEVSDSCEAWRTLEHEVSDVLGGGAPGMSVATSRASREGTWTMNARRSLRQAVFVTDSVVHGPLTKAAVGDRGYCSDRLGSETGETLYESVLELSLPITANPNAGAARCCF